MVTLKPSKSRTPVYDKGDVLVWLVGSSSDDKELFKSSLNGEVSPNIFWKPHDVSEQENKIGCHRYRGHSAGDK